MILAVALRYDRLLSHLSSLILPVSVMRLALFAYYTYIVFQVKTTMTATIFNSAVDVAVAVC